MICILLSMVLCGSAESGHMLLGPGSTCMMAVSADGSIWGWGENGNGQLGLGNKKRQLQPVCTAENLDGNEVVQIRGGKAHMLFLLQDGTMYACGHNAEGQLGLGKTGKDVLIPQQIPELSGIRQFAVGHNHALALDTEGHVWAWGQNDKGQVGNGTRKNQAEPWKLPLENISRVVCGRKFSLAMAEDGTIYGWGDNEYGQLLNASRLKPVLEPVRLELNAQYTDLCCGNASVLALDTEGILWAWGRNDYWQLGNREAGKKQAEPVRVVFPEPVSIAYMDGFNIHSAILTEQGAVWQWGACGHGQYGLGERPWRSLAVQACPAQNVMKVAVNTYTSYILMDDGRVLACGGNWYGQAGTHRKISHYVMNWTETGLNLLDSQWQDPND